jgi:hypothetical protein
MAVSFFTSIALKFISHTRPISKTETSVRHCQDSALSTRWALTLSHSACSLRPASREVRLSVTPTEPTARPFSEMMFQLKSIQIMLVKYKYYKLLCEIVRYDLIKFRRKCRVNSGETTGKPNSGFAWARRRLRCSAGAKLSGQGAETGAILTAEYDTGQAPDREHAGPGPRFRPAVLTTESESHVARGPAGRAPAVLLLWPPALPAGSGRTAPPPLRTPDERRRRTLYGEVRTMKGQRTHWGK